MNQKTNQPVATPFQPFAPPPPPMFEGQVQSGGVSVPAAIPAAPAPKRRKASPRKAAKKASAAKPAAPKRKKPTGDRHVVAAAPKPASQPKRKARGAPKGKRAPKFELGQILRIAAGMKESDQKLFENMLGELSATPKAARRRVLGALAQVFG